MKGLLLIAVLFLTGCACAVPAGLATIGIAGAVVTGDPSHAIMPVVECVGCVVRAARGTLPAP